MTATRFFHFCSHEQFPPEALLDQAVAAERAGFDGITCSDHLSRGGSGGESAHAWIWLGAAGQATRARAARAPALPRPARATTRS